MSTSVARVEAAPPRVSPVRRSILVAISIAALALTAVYMAVVFRNFHNVPNPDHGSHFVAAGRFLLWIFVGCVAWVRRPANPIGRWMIAVGFAGFLFVPVLVTHPLSWTVGSILAPAEIALGAYVFLAFPDGRLQDRLDRVLMLGIIAWWIGSRLLLLRFADGRPDLNLLYESPEVRSVADLLFYWQRAADLPRVAEIGNSILGCLLIGEVIRHWYRSGPAARRAMNPVVLGVVAVAGVLAIAWIDLVVGPNVVTAFLDEPRGYLIAGFVGYVLPIFFLIGVLRTRLARASVVDVVRELDAGVAPGRLESVLRRALRDPTLRLAYRLPDGGFVNAGGENVNVPAPGPAIGVTPLGSRESRAVVIHDPALADEPELLQAVAAAAGLALENERLHAEVQAQLTEVRASRGRIVEAGLEARRRIERDLHDGAQQRLLALVVRLQLARARASADPTLEAMLASAGGDLETAIAELRVLARGIHPAVLTDSGLAPAIENLVDRASIAIDLDVTEERCSEACEATAYFIVSEALANVSRHAGTDRAALSIHREGDDLVVSVSDGGVGGADPARGSGLRGLSDRVAAVGGRLAVESHLGRGTQLVARIPCE